LISDYEFYRKGEQLNFYLTLPLMFVFGGLGAIMIGLASEKPPMHDLNCVYAMNNSTVAHLPSLVGVSKIYSLTFAYCWVAVAVVFLIGALYEYFFMRRF
jgi:hypothetical protein